MGLPIFRYVTLSAVKDRLDPLLLFANDPLGLTDAMILLEVEKASAKVNRWTDQVFQTYPEAVRVRGRGTRLISHPKHYPVMDMLQATFFTDRSQGRYKQMERVLPGMSNSDERFHSNNNTNNNSGYYSNVVAGLDGETYAWDRGSRQLEAITKNGGWREGYNNYEFAAWWGWVSNPKCVKTTLTVAIPLNTAVTTITVDTIFDADLEEFIEVGDSIAIEVIAGAYVPRKVEMAIVTAIAANGADYDLTIDTTHSFPMEIPIGAQVDCYGKVHQDIETIVEYMAYVSATKLGAARVGNEDIALAISGTLIKEKTDKYSYELDPKSGDNASFSGSYARIGHFTGSVQLDLLLHEYMNPILHVGVI